MKGKLLYFVLIAGTVVLVAVLATLTNVLLELSVPKINIDPPPENHLVTTSQEPLAPVQDQSIDMSTSVKIPEVKPRIEPKPEKDPLPVITLKKKPNPSVKAKKTAPPTPAVKKADVRIAVGAEIGEVVLLRGEAYATNENKKQRALSEKSLVFLNDTIETAKGARLKIKFLDGSIVMQGEESSMLVDEYIYSPDNEANSMFAMRFIKGACRVLTGLITDINPERFKVQTRMATIGIRGCEVGFRTTFERDDVYVLSLPKGKVIDVQASKTGQLLRNLHTGDLLRVDKKALKTVTVIEPGSRVSVLKGIGIESGSIGMDEARDIIGETTHIPPARYKVINKPDGAIFTLFPEDALPGNNQDKVK